MQDKLVALASTSLDNRRAFYDKANAILPSPSGVPLMIDVDHFKRVNDTFGHQIGDLCLQAIADRLRQVTRAHDIVVRMGGEEFAVILVGSDVAKTQDIAMCLTHGVPIPGRHAQGNTVSHCRLVQLSILRRCLLMMGYARRTWRYTLQNRAGVRGWNGQGRTNGTLWYARTIAFRFKCHDTVIAQPYPCDIWDQK